MGCLLIRPYGSEPWGSKTRLVAVGLVLWLIFVLLFWFPGYLLTLIIVPLWLLYKAVTLGIRAYKYLAPMVTDIKGNW